MHIVDKKRYLALDFVDSSDNESRISYIYDASEFVGAWSAHTRVSPIWPLVSDRDTVSEHRDTIPQNCFIFFAGPVNPANLDLQFGPNFNKAFPASSVWASLGVLNLIICTTSNEENDLLREFFKDLAVVCEIWTVEDSVIVEVDIPQPINGAEVSEQVSPSQVGKTEFGTVAGKELELITTSLTIKHRGSPYYTWVESDVVKLMCAYEEVVEGYRGENGKIDLIHEADLVYALANINSGLSRFASQSLSGTAPIRITECHFWPHSLLGIGLCNASLRKCVAFVEGTLGQYKIVERFESLSGKAAHDRPPNLDDYTSLNRDLLAEVPPIRDDILVTPISYYSGRDNFKNDVFTVSVPLDTIGGLNSKKWSILTVTHELSHRFVEPVISKLIPKKVEDVRCGRSSKPKFSKYAEPTTYLELAERDFLRCTLAYAASIGYNVDRARENEEDLTWVIDLLRAHNMHIEEIFVHVFDFLYFYGGRAEKYVPDIWNSWGVLPHIETKLDEYIVRTAAALLSNKVTINNPLPSVRKEILDFLPLASDNPAAHLDEVRRRVSSNEYWDQHLAGRCEAAEMSARFVLQYLHSDEAMSSMRGEEVISSTKRKYDYDFSGLRLDSRGFKNPLSFLSSYAIDLEPDETKSLWLYTMLSFALDIGEDG